MIFYVLVGIIGYATTFDNTPPVYIQRSAPWGLDYPMVIAQALMAFALCVGNMLNYTAMRSSAFNLILGNSEVTFTK